MGIIRENGVERDFLRGSLYRQGDQVIAKNILGATKFNTDLIPFSLVSWYFIMCPGSLYLSASLLPCPSSISMMGISSSFYLPYLVVLELLYLSV